MKTLLFLNSLFALLVFSCSSNVNKTKVSSSLVLDNSEEKIVKNITYQPWNGGTKEAGSGYDITIQLNKTDAIIELENIYFRHIKGIIKSTSEGFTANLKIEAQKDTQLSAIRSDEYENELPKKKAFPFQLNDNECVISYFINNRHKFIRVSNLKALETINYPSANPKN